MDILYELAEEAKEVRRLLGEKKKTISQINGIMMVKALTRSAMSKEQIDWFIRFNQGCLASGEAISALMEEMEKSWPKDAKDLHSQRKALACLRAMRSALIGFQDLGTKAARVLNPGARPA